MAEILSVVALLLATWAVMAINSTKEEALHRAVALQARLSALEERVESLATLDELHGVEQRVERVEEGFIAATAPLSVEPWPPILRTPPGGERPEVREVRTEEK